MPKLIDLEPQFCRRDPRLETVRVIRPEFDPGKTPPGGWRDEHIMSVERIVEYLVYVDTLAEADGIYFLCPFCFLKDGRHHVLCWFVGRVPDDCDPRPGRWVPRGTGYADLSFVGPASASVRLTSGCKWHGHIANGNVTILGDSGR